MKQAVVALVVLLGVAAHAHGRQLRTVDEVSVNGVQINPNAVVQLIGELVTGELGSMMGGVNGSTGTNSSPVNNSPPQPGTGFCTQNCSFSPSPTPAVGSSAATSPASGNANTNAASTNQSGSFNTTPVVASGGR